MRIHFSLLFTLWVVTAGTQCCQAPERKCDFVCDCTDCEDELDCGYTGEQFVCDFEQGDCGWTVGSVDAPYKWERRQRGDAFTDGGPSSDYTIGTATGWFMAVTAVRLEGVTRAVLVSPEMRQSAPTCQVNLRYFIWDSGLTGLGDAPLWASVRYPGGEEEAVVWRPEPTSVRGWREATVFVGRISSTFRLVFYSERGHGQSADIALDQLHFQHCALPAPPEGGCGPGMFQCSNQACVEQRLSCDGTDNCGDGSDEQDCEIEGYKRCDFDEGLCDIWDLRSLSSLRWVRTNQQNISTTDPMRGPGRDHSNNTATGHFLYVTVPESELKKDWAAFQTKLLDPTDSCKMVMYTHQFGPRSGGLTVLVADQNIYPAWERGGALGDLWVRAEVEVRSSSTFQIVIMAAIRDFDYGGIGVDSIVLSPGCQLSTGNWTLADFPKAPPNPCTSPEKMCDFQVDCEAEKDEDTCGDFAYPEGHKGWTDSSVGSQGWLRNVYSATSKEVVLYVAESAGYQRTPAQMKTPLLGPSGPVCTISFDYALTGSPDHIGELSVRVMDSVLGPLPKVWEFAGKTGTDGESWNHTDVYIGERRSRFQLAFEGQVTEINTTAEIKVANISFHNCSQNDYSYAPTGMSCNFEDGLCEWYQDNNDNFDWTLLDGMDHTISIGRSLVVDLWDPSLRGAFGRLLSHPQSPSTTGTCLFFFYKLYGPNTGTLNVKLLDENGYELTLWSRTGAHGNMWHEAQCPVPQHNIPYRLMFEAARSGFDGRIAIDDVAFRDTECTSVSKMCSFEGSPCDYSSFGKVKWRHINGFSASDPKTDHTLETAEGYYMLLNTGSDVLPARAKSTLTSPLIYGTSKTQCLQFWYHMGGARPGSLTVYMKPVKGKRVEIFSNRLNQGEVWRHGSGDISPDLVDWQLQFEVIGAGGKNSHVAIDDVHILNHACESQDSKCSLEKGLCSWTNTQDVLKDRLDWELSSQEAERHYPAPEADHTLGHEKGHFLFLPSSDRTAANQNAWLLSPHLPPTKGTCLKVWANMPFSGVSELKVWLRSEGKNAELLSTSETGGSWRRFDVNITSTKEYQIVLEGIKGSSGFLALDDIEYTVGVDCAGTVTDKKRLSDVGGIAASVIVCLLLVATLIALLVIYLRSRNQQRPSPAGPVGFTNQSYESDLTEDRIRLPPAQNHPMAAGFNHFSDYGDISSMDLD